MVEQVQWKQWVPPTLNQGTNKWEVKVLDADENLLETFEYDSLPIAEAEMKTKIIDELLTRKTYG